MERLLLILIALVLVGCGAPEAPVQCRTPDPSAFVTPYNTDVRLQGVIEGDASNVNKCTGVVIGPRSILTAAHCFSTGSKEWRVLTPGGKRIATATEYVMYRAITSSKIDTDHPDLAILYTDTDIIRDAYPIISSSDATSSSATVVDRTGTAHPVTLLDGAHWSVEYVSYNEHYLADKVIIGGDSGGGVYANGKQEIVGVVTGYKHCATVITRVDRFAAWVTENTR